VGDEIGVAGNTERSSVGSLVSSVTRIPVGIIMNVTPAISDDGFVRMEINPEISQLTNRTTQINRDQTAPVITRRKVETVVTVRDGQSVVIGGLIQTTQEQRRTKVPLLGDIPVIGAPFRTKINEARKTELLVIVTPRVIPGIPGTAHGMAEDVSGQAIDRMEDPSRVLDFLENIKADIKATREKQLKGTFEGLDPARTGDAEASPLDGPPASTEIPAPVPVFPEYVSPQREQDGPRVVPK
jgi:Flp pilus assembly secretin CpaC